MLEQARDERAMASGLYETLRGLATWPRRKFRRRHRRHQTILVKGRLTQSLARESALVSEAALRGAFRTRARMRVKPLTKVARRARTNVLPTRRRLVNLRISVLRTRLLRASLRTSALLTRRLLTRRPTRSLPKALTRATSAKNLRRARPSKPSARRHFFSPRISPFI